MLGKIWHRGLGSSPFYICEEHRISLKLKSYIEELFRVSSLIISIHYVYQSRGGQLFLRVVYTDIHWRSQNSYTATCNDVASHGVKLGAFGFLPTTHAKHTQNKCTHNLHTLCSILRVFIFTLGPL